MTDTARHWPQSFWLGSSLLFGLLGLCYLLALVEAKRAHDLSLPVLNPIADFTLTNEAAQVTTLADLTNHVWVADIIFTRCAGPCPRMTRQMKSLQDLLPATSNAILVTLTTDPEFDTPPVLARYAAHYQADTHRWMFLTGTKKEIAGLAADSLKLGAVPVAPADRQGEFDLFIHTTIFVLVDKHAHLRGVFETGGDGVDWTVVQVRLKNAVKQLENEP
jgi:cytochrome oxidase Cu insertion factor (SCO1/SenC/PrrC family)